MCLLAALSGYQVSFSLQEGFRFEPATRQAAVDGAQAVRASAGFPLTVRHRANFVTDHVAHHVPLPKA